MLFDNELFTPTPTSEDQARTEAACAPLLLTPNPLRRAAHVAYLAEALAAPSQPAGWATYDASRVWLTYWCLQGLDVLGAAHEPAVAALHPGVVAFLAACQASGGGFGGGPGQEAHAASTYAAVSALLIIGTPAALSVPHRPSLAAFFASLRQPSGALRVTADGEADTRGAYTVLAVASLLNMASPALTSGTAAFLARCQSQEGGFGGEPGNEAHGGYTYCALAALAVLGGGALGGVDAGALARWLRARQMGAEGGFSGRCNKLVDACYSFWLAAACALAPGGGFEAEPAARYVLRCAQVAAGGCRDKPGKSRDHYHTCYALCGLSAAQGAGGGAGAEGGGGLHGVDPVFNLRPERVAAARAYYGALPAL